MGLSALMNSATSALVANQAALRATSSNIANVNTPNYVRLDAKTQQAIVGAEVGGVSLTIVRAAADRFLQAASFQSRAAASGADQLSSLMQRAQAILGDPSGQGSLFNRIDELYAAAADVAADPLSGAARAALISDVEILLTTLSEAGREVQSLRAVANTALPEQLSRANDLLAQIAALNPQIVRGAATGEQLGAAAAQSSLVNELSGLMDFRILPKPDGSIELRTTDGLLMVGGSVAARLTYAATDSVGAATAFPPILLELPGAAGATTPFDHRVTAGTIRSLLDARDGPLADMAGQIGELSGKLVDALNIAHNAGAAYPPPQALRGKQTGLLATDAHNFTGATTLAVIGRTPPAMGQMFARLEIDFSAGTINGAPAFAPTGTIGDVAAAINAALGGAATATFANGQFSVVAAAPDQGIALAEGPGAPSNRSGRGFSAFFGLNDLVVATRPTNYATGLAATDADGVTPGSQMQLRIVSARGEVLADATLAVGGGTIGDLMAALTTPATGLAQFMTFTLDADGRLGAQPASGYDGARLQVVRDDTLRGATGLSLSQIFGLSAGVRADRSNGLAVRADIAGNNRLLAAGQLELSAAIGQTAVAAGDSRGAQGLLQATRAPIAFDGIGGLLGGTMSAASYASRLAGDVGRVARGAERDAQSAAILADDVAKRRAAVEGVNLDEELVKMTVLQQSYAAAARVVRVADELYEVLLSMV